MANRSDTFNRTGSVALNGATPSDGGGTWTDLPGSFATGTDAVSGQVVCFVNAGSTWDAWLNCGVTDHESSGEIINVGTATQSGITARQVDDNNYYYYFVNASGAASLYKKVNGGYTLMGSGTHTFTPGVGNNISLKAQGTTITGYVGATQDVQVTDTSLTTGTKAGIRCTPSSFQPYYNSFSITDLSGGGGGGILYTQLERGTRGLVRGVYGGGL